MSLEIIQVHSLESAIKNVNHRVLGIRKIGIPILPIFDKNWIRLKKESALSPALYAGLKPASTS